MSTLNRTATPATSRVWTAGLIGIAAAVIANLLLRAIIVPIFGLSTEFRPFGYFPIAQFTALGTFMGLLVFWFITRRSATPLRTFNLVTAIAFFVSILPNIGAMLNPAAAPFPGTALDYGVLMIFHLVAAVVFVGVLNARYKA